MTETLTHPPFPLLTWDDGDWTAEAVLPEWAGFQTRRGWYNAVNSPDPSDGSVRLRVIRPRGAQREPAAEQSTAFEHLCANGALVRDAILAAVFAEYPKFREDYLDCFDDEEGEDFADIAAGVPEVSSSHGLRSLMGLGNVFILDVFRDGMAYVGFEFGCEWESEHGLGVMTHGDRVIDIGQAPTAFDGHASKADGGR